MYHKRWALHHVIKLSFFYMFIWSFSTKLCHFHFRISSLTSSEQSDRTLSECPSVVSACQILNKLNHLCGVVISIFKKAAMEFPDSIRITTLSESTANLRMYFRLWCAIFYFRFRFWPIYIHRPVILPRPAKVYPNWSTSGGGMTTTRFFTMLAVHFEIYFRVQV